MGKSCTHARRATCGSECAVADQEVAVGVPAALGVGRFVWLDGPDGVLDAGAWRKYAKRVRLGQHISRVRSEHRVKHMDEVKPTRVSDEVVADRTGKEFDDWAKLLDEAGAAEWTHSARAAWLADQHDLDRWWCQHVTVAYEQARGLRVPGQRGDGTFSATVTRTVARLGRRCGGAGPAGARRAARAAAHHLEPPSQAPERPMASPGRLDTRGGSQPERRCAHGPGAGTADQFGRDPRSQGSAPRAARHTGAPARLTIPPPGNIFNE